MPRYSIALLIALICITFTVHAQITLDGTLGQSGALPGPDYQIGADLGQQHGGNLFHSFRDFNLQSHESATFSGPNNVQNIISRVTGGNPSSIDGTLRSTIPNADMYFLNPDGVMFGPNAKLDVQGGFHVSTADYLRLQDGGRFEARVPSNSLLTVAPVAAFGFLTEEVGEIRLQDSVLEVPVGRTLSLIGGKLEINGNAPPIYDENGYHGSRLFTSSGRLNLASVASRGEVIPTPLGLDLTTSTKGGNITVTNTGLNTWTGDIFIRGGQFEMTHGWIRGLTSDQAGGVTDIQVDNLTLRDGAEISSGTTGVGQSGAIHLHVSDTLTLSGQDAKGNGGAISAGSYNQKLEKAGNAGSIEIEARQIALTDGGKISANTHGTGQGGSLTLKAENLTLTGSDVTANSYGTMPQAGNAGNITIQARQVNLANWAQIDSFTRGGGQGGTIHLHVSDTLTLSGQDANGFSSAISTSSYNEELEKAGNAGNIEIEARQIALTDGGKISANTYGTGQGGSLTLKAENLTLTGSDVSANSNGTMPQSGNAGNITIQARQVNLADGAQINSFTRGGGQGGTIYLHVADTLTLSGQDANGNFSAISTSSYNEELEKAGNAGSIEIEARQMVLTDGTQVNGNTYGTGQGGSLTLKVEILTLTDSLIVANSHGTTPQAGNAGNITIQARQVNLAEGAQINSFTRGSGHGGTIHLHVTDTLTATGQDAEENISSINAVSNNQELEKAGNAGSIEIEARQIVLTNGVRVNSNTEGTGQGGSIILKVTDDLTLAGTDKNGMGCFIYAGSRSTKPQSGNAGQITVQARQVNLADGSQINSSTFGDGQGGTIHLQVAETLTATGQNAQGYRSGIVARSGYEKLERPSNASGNAGNIEIESPQIVLTNGGQINTRANNASGGNIILLTSNLLYLRDGQITTSVKGGTSGGGNINIKTPVFLLLDKAEIIAQADEGKGGNITITANHRISSKPESNNVIDASSKKNVSGKVVIKAQEEKVTGTLTILPATLKNYEFLKKHCTVEKLMDDKKRNRFAITGRGGVSETPTDLQAGSVRDVMGEQLW